MDHVDLLEAKVKQMIELVQALRDENQALAERLAAAEARERDMADQRAALDRERDTVRDRIENLLGELAGVERARAGGSEAAEGAGGDAGDRAEAPREAAAHADNPVLPGL